MVSQLHPGHLCPAAAACPSCSSDPAIGMVPSTPGLCRKQTALSGHAAPWHGYPIVAERRNKPHRVLRCPHCLHHGACQQPSSARPEEGSGSREEDRDATRHLFSATAPGSLQGTTLVRMWPVISPSPPREEGACGRIWPPAVPEEEGVSFIASHLSPSFCFLFPEGYPGCDHRFQVEQSCAGSG